MFMICSKAGEKPLSAPLEPAQTLRADCSLAARIAARRIKAYFEALIGAP
jgi:hypothetical protein